MCSSSSSNRSNTPATCESPITADTQNTVHYGQTRSEGELWPNFLHMTSIVKMGEGRYRQNHHSFTLSATETSRVTFWRIPFLLVYKHYHLLPPPNTLLPTRRAKKPHKKTPNTQSPWLQMLCLLHHKSLLGRAVCLNFYMPPLEIQKKITKQNTEGADLLFSPLKCIRAVGWKGPFELGVSTTIPVAVLVHANMSEPR